MEPEDTDLVAGSKRGDLSAFNALVERYQSRVYNVAARILGDRTAAEDVAQETFISAHRAIGRFRGGSLRAWLMRIATNHSYDAIRSARRRPEQSLDEAGPSLSLPAAPRGSSPEEAALQGELRAEIQRAILALSSDQRATLVLIDVQGLSYQEAAEATRASLGTVKSRLSRARSATRTLLQRRMELLPDKFRQTQ